MAVGDHEPLPCTLWVHDDTFSKELVLFNPASLDSDKFGPGTVVQVRSHPSHVSGQAFADDSATAPKGSSTALRAIDLGAGSVLQQPRAPSLVFVSRLIDADVTSRNPKLQLSVSYKIAELFSFQKNSEVWISRADPKLHTATHVEIAFRDVYLTRADMQRIAISCLVGNSFYAGQQIVFAGCVRARVKSIYRHGCKLKSAMITSDTKPIFRSESSRFILYIQMSKEMWDFDKDGSGEISFSKVVNGVLPTLFQKWSDINARHLVSIVLFTRIEYDRGPRTDGNGRGPGDSYARSELPPKTRDFYRVVVGEMSSDEWTEILHQLKKEFRAFLRDILLYDEQSATTEHTHTSEALFPSTIAGTPCTAERSNILEAINTAAAPFSKDWIDTDLFRTGLSIVVVTPGTGVFEVDESMLRLTTDNLVKNGINIDLICLSRPPLHVAPLFRYFPRHRDSTLERHDPISDSSISSMRPIYASTPPFANTVLERVLTPAMDSSAERSGPKPAICVVPQWAHIHFWQGNDHPDHADILRKPTTNSSQAEDVEHARVRCSLYDIQMSGIMESEMNSISIPHLTLASPRTLNSSEGLNNSHQSNNIHAGSMQETPQPLMYIPRAVQAVPYSHSSDRRPFHSLYGDLKSMEEYDNWLYGVSLTATGNSISRPLPLRRQSSDRRRHRRDSQLTIGLAEKREYTNSPERSSPPLTQHIKLEQVIHPKITTNLSNMKHSTLKNTQASLIRGTSQQTTPSTNTSRFDSRRLLATGLRPGLGKSAAIIVPSYEQGSRSAAEGPNWNSHNSEELTQLVSTQVKNTLSRQPKPSSMNSKHSSRASSVTTAPSDMPIPDSKSVEGSRSEFTDVEAVDFVPSSMSPQRHPKSAIVIHRDMSGPEGLRDLSSTSLPIDLAPWLTVTNPARPDEAVTYDHGWSHAFTHPSQGLASKMKWKSLCSPAALPLTSDYMIGPQLLAEYEERPHKVALEEEDGHPSLAFSRARLLSDLIAFRLAKGFQIIRNTAAAATEPVPQMAIAFDDKPLVIDGCTVTLVKGNQVHILCATGSEIQVTRYQPKSSNTFSSLASVVYEPVIKSSFEPTYAKVPASLYLAQDGLNWSMIDNCLAGHFDNLTEATGYWRARFVLVPVEIPKHTRRGPKATADDTDDELRIEGVQRLTQIWDSSRLTGNELRIISSGNSRKDPNPLGLEFQTRDASAVISAGLEDSRLLSGQSFVPSTRLFSDEDLYRADKIDVKKLAFHLQGDGGIDIKDRWWYLHLHHHAFLGSDLTTWLLRNFKDVNTREEAEHLGCRLLELGLFKHVRGTHTFRDGNYFYSITSEYRNVRPQTRGFFSLKHDKSSAPSTPLAEVGSRDVSRMSTLDKSAMIPGSPSNSPSVTRSRKSAEKRRVHLSSLIQCDLDVRQRSSRPEIIHIHYDRLFNPESCYHFRLEWMNTTARLVEEAMSSWATMLERYGLRLVEVPIAEGCKIAEENPFRTPSVLVLAVPPPEMEPDLSHVDSTAPEPLPTHRYHPYQRALLKRFGFILDVEAAVNFPDDIDVKYSFAHQGYTYSQYIHKTGLVLAQVDLDGRLLLVANRLANNRTTFQRDATARMDKRDFDKRPSPHISARPSSSAYPTPNFLGSPASQPFSFERTSHQMSPSAKAEKELSTAEAIKEELEKFCRSEVALIEFYEEVSQKDPVLMSPRSTPAMGPRQAPSARSTPMLQATIPTLELPPISGISELLSLAPTQSNDLLSESKDREN